MIFVVLVGVVIYIVVEVDVDVDDYSDSYFFREIDVPVSCIF